MRPHLHSSTMSNPNPVWFLKPYKGPPLSARYSQNSLTPYSGSCTDPSARSAPPSLIAVTADSRTHTDRAPRLRSILSLPRPLHPAPGHPHPSAPQRSVPPCFSYIPLRLDWYPSPSCCTPLPDLPSHSMAPALCFCLLHCLWTCPGQQNRQHQSGQLQGCEMTP